MGQGNTDCSLSLEELIGFKVGDPEEAPTPMVAASFKSWRKPLDKLSDDEIGRLVVQNTGYPYLLDVLWPKLNANPLFDGGYYPGDVLSNLIRAEIDIWVDRPSYKAELASSYHRALDRPDDERYAFRESLKLPGASSRH